jgi:hypothetical protein
MAGAVIILLVGGFFAQKWTMPTKNTATPLTDTMATVSKPAPQKNKTSKTKKSNRNDTRKKNKKSDSTRKNEVIPAKKDKSSADTITSVTHPAKADVPSSKIFKQVYVSYSRDTTHKTGIAGLNFTIHNRSDFKLSVVAIDVSYNHAGHQVQKETIYFNNISPGGRASTAAPDNQKASSVSYHLSLVSTDDHIFYGKD